jgi:hypothetical protein
MTAGGPAPLSAPIDPRVAAERLADWGFLAHPDLPDLSGDAYLLVALRATPTLHHFDPERMTVWVSEGSRGRRLEIEHATSPLETEFSWGTIEIVDRLGVSNEYAASGGHLTVADVDGTTIVICVSPAPILRCGGHSQGWDEGAVDLAAFFGRILVAVDYVPGFEARMAAARPLARYASFIAASDARYRTSEALRAEHQALWTLLRSVEERLRRDHPDDWAHGTELVVAAGLEAPAEPGSPGHERLV